MSKNKRFLIFICIVTLIGGINIALSGMLKYLLLYAFVTSLAITAAYFNYSLCKMGNRWHSRLYHRYHIADDEPSDLWLIRCKISSWICYCLGLFLSLVATFL